MIKNNTPVWNRYVLTIVEAAEYYHIGEKKLRRLFDEHPKADFIIMNGNRVLLKKNNLKDFWMMHPMYKKHGCDYAI